MQPRSEHEQASGPAADPTAYEVLDEALASLAEAGPDLRNGLTNHAPMVAEALCALGRGDAVLPWLGRYREGLLPWPARRRELAGTQLETALGRPERVSDWREFFARELGAEPWPFVLERWIARLAPALCANATHGVIRVGHAVRALGVGETPLRRQELADALATWAATWQRLPAAPSDAAALPPQLAILRVPLVPASQRRFRGTITGSLEALSDFAPFAPVIAFARLEGDPGDVVSELTETFARVFLAGAHDPLTAIVFVHGVTGAAALRPLLPHLREETALAALRFAWQAGCALHSAFGARAVAEAPGRAPLESGRVLVEAAIASGDDHAIKFNEACLHEHARRPSPTYLAAARHALDHLGGAAGAQALAAAPSR